MQKTAGIHEELSCLDYPQCVFGIVRHFLGAPKHVYSLRTNTATNELIEFVKLFENCERKALDQNLGTLIYDHAWQQAWLSISLSGYGSDNL